MLQNGQPWCSPFRESSAAVTGISAVGVYDDFSSGQSAVTVRSADYETAGRVDIIFCILIDHLLRKDRIEDIFLDILVDLLLSYIRSC